MNHSCPTVSVAGGLHDLPSGDHLGVPTLPIGHAARTASRTRPEPRPRHFGDGVPDLEAEIGLDSPLPTTSRCYGPEMLAQVVLPCADLAVSSAFYEAVLAPLSVSKVYDEPNDKGFGVMGQPDFWIEQLQGDERLRELHIAFIAPDRDAVDEFFRIAVAVGTEQLHAPTGWPRYDYYNDPVYYAAFVRDPDGNNTEAVCHTTA